MTAFTDELREMMSDGGRTVWAVVRNGWFISAVVISILLYVLWLAEGRHPFPFKITVELEVEGEPVTLTRVIRCVTRTESQGIGAKTLKYWEPEIGSFCARLKNGAGVFLPTPNGCDLRVGSEGSVWGWSLKAPDPNYLPFIAWTADAANPETFEAYITREAVTEPGRRVKYKGLTIEKPDGSEPLSEIDQFAWFRLGTPHDMNVPVLLPYESHYAICLRTDDPRMSTILRDEVEKSELPRVLEGDPLAAAAAFADQLSNSSNFFANSQKSYRGEFGAEMRTDPINSALHGNGIPPFPMLGEERSPPDDAQDYSDMIPIEQSGREWRLGERKGQLSFIKRSGILDKPFSSKANPLELSVDRFKLRLDRQGTAFVLPATGSLCLANGIGKILGPNKKRIF